MDKYFIVFRINLLERDCKVLCSLCDVYDNHPVIRGFQTKRAMQEFAAKFSYAMHEYTLLKPVS